MKALILKDLLCLRQQAKSVGLVLLVWLVLSVAMGNGMFFCALGVIYVIMLPMMTLSYDERSKWDSRAMTMPVTRAQLVLSRYATALLAGLALCALGAVVIAVVDGPEKAANSLGFYLAGALMLAVAMPLMLKLGVEEGADIGGAVLSGALPGSAAGGEAGRGRGGRPRGRSPAPARPS